MDYKEKMKIERLFSMKLDQQYEKVHVFGVGESWKDQIFVSQSNKDKGMVIGSISDDGIIDEKVRQLKQGEMQDIIDFFQYQAEPHDLDNFAKDVFSVEQ